MAERRHPSDGEARCVAHLVALCLPHTGTELLGVHAPVAGAQTQKGRFLVDEHEGLDDLPDLDADRVRRFQGGAGGVGELPNLDIEAELPEACLETLCCWMH